MIVKDKKTVVYIAINLINGKRYIGITSHDLSTRKSQHKYAAFKLHAVNNLFQNAIRKYGFEMFRFSIIEECSSFYHACLEEIRLIATLKPEYNLNRGGEGNFGFQHSEEKRKKVICLNDGKIFESTSHAGEFYDVFPVSISKLCLSRKGFDTVGGRKFAFYNGQKIEEKDFLPMKKNFGPRKVVCVNDGLTFKSIKAASLYYNIGRQAIGMVCRKKLVTVNGLSFVCSNHVLSLEERNSILESNNIRKCKWRKQLVRWNKESA